MSCLHDCRTSRNKTELHAENILRQAHATSRKPASSFAEFEKCWNSIGANAADRVTYLGYASVLQSSRL